MYHVPADVMRCACFQLASADCMQSSLREAEPIDSALLSMLSLRYLSRVSEDVATVGIFGTAARDFSCSALARSKREGAPRGHYLEVDQPEGAHLHLSSLQCGSSAV